MPHSKPPINKSSTDAALNRIIDIMRRLRDPQTGCPWDVKQTFETMRPTPSKSL